MHCPSQAKLFHKQFLIPHDTCQWAPRRGLRAWEEETASSQGSLGCITPYHLLRAQGRWKWLLPGTLEQSPPPAAAPPHSHQPLASSRGFLSTLYSEDDVCSHYYTFNTYLVPHSS